MYQINTKDRLLFGVIFRYSQIERRSDLSIQYIFERITGLPINC